MLVLSRKLGEKIYIGDNICITVVDIDRGKIRLGIEAPRDVPIYRQELLPLYSYCFFYFLKTTKELLRMQNRLQWRKLFILEIIIIAIIFRGQTAYKWHRSLRRTLVLQVLMQQ